jgi:predicted Zn-dependent peptidase
MRIHKTILKNGLRLLTVPMKDTGTVTVLALVEAGSKYESKKESGLSHFLEHMCFKGTSKRPQAIDISRELDSLGAQSNAFTSHEYTGYYAKGAAKHFPKLFDVVSDIYLNSTLPAGELEKEKGVIVEEINMYEDMPQRHVQDLFMELLYGDQPAGWSIAGTKESVRSFVQEDFIQYKKNHYVPKATAIIVAGNIDEKKVKNIAEKIFGSVAEGKKKSKVKVIDVQSKPKILLKEKKTDQIHFVLGVRSFNVHSKKSPATALLASVLAGGMSSRLFQKLREEMGVCYYVRSVNDPYTDHGFFEISAGVDTKRFQEVVTVILAECKKLKDILVTDEELAKVKEYVIGHMKIELESSDSVAYYFGGQEILKRPLKTPEQAEKEIRAVTKAQIQKIAQEIFIPKNLNLAAIGPKQDERKLLSLLKF